MAQQEYRRIVAEALDMQQLAGVFLADLGPARDCAACAATPTSSSSNNNSGNSSSGGGRSGDPGSAASSSNGATGLQTLRHMEAPTSQQQQQQQQAPVGTTSTTATAADTDAAEAACKPSYIPDAANLRPVIKAVCGDANVKLNRYRSAGKAHSKVQASRSTYFAAANDAVWAAAGIGQLPGRSNSSSTDEDVAPCGHSQLGCSRPGASHGGISEIHGDCGFVYVHGVPLVGTFVAMPAPEMHMYYDSVWKHGLSGTDVMDFYLDINCQYSKHFTNSAVTKSQPERFLVPWFHAQSHGRQCNLAFGGMYQYGAGRRVGEQTEHLWAQAKQYASITRYMARPNYFDFLEDAFSTAAASKRATLPAQLVHMQQAAATKQGEGGGVPYAVCFHPSRHTCIKPQ